MSLTFDEFKDKAIKVLNINLNGYKIKRVKRRTDSLMRRHDIEDYDQCLHLLKNNPEFKAAYIGHFTINTSEFYRNPDNFKYLEQEILPGILTRNNRVKIWSAPCSNGSEPYTVALILKEMGINSDRYQILASDLDPDILDTARRGIYKPSSLKNVPETVKDKYFQLIDSSEKRYQLDKTIINRVDFKNMDLINDNYQKNWDLILSRNFFIYLTKDLKDMLTQKFVDVLKPGGYLFLGNTEFIFNAGQYGLEKEYLSFYKKVD
ncbi:MAG: CheR family methyltransferase [Bacillota bacterium]